MKRAGQRGPQWKWWWWADFGGYSTVLVHLIRIGRVNVAVARNRGTMTPRETYRYSSSVTESDR